MYTSNVVHDWCTQCPPKPTPDMTVLIAPRSIPYFSPPANSIPAPIAIAIGTTTGNKIAMVPHEVPVENAIIEAIRNTTPGRRGNGRVSASRDARYVPVPNSCRSEEHTSELQSRGH